MVTHENTEILDRQYAVSDMLDYTDKFNKYS